MTKLFLENITILDCAIWQSNGVAYEAKIVANKSNVNEIFSIKNGNPAGKSWRVDVLLEGFSDSDGILFDFGLAKKTIKRVIDENFDHRFICPESLTEIVDFGRIFKSEDFYLKAPEQNFALCSDFVFESLSKNDLTPLCHRIAERISLELPANLATINVKLVSEEYSEKFPECEYLHSLKFHNGNCQRFHGHSNGIKILKSSKLDFELTQKAQRFLSNKYLVSEDYKASNSAAISLVGESNWNTKNFESIVYSGSQGEFQICIPKSRVLFMKSESTIENIAQFIHSRLSLSDNEQVFSYEGIGKGSVYP